jgi:hypothetical protein
LPDDDDDDDDDDDEEEEATGAETCTGGLKPFFVAWGAAGMPRLSVAAASSSSS